MSGMEAFHRAYGCYPLQRQGVCGDVGRDAVAFGDGDDLAYPVFDAHDALGGATLIVALQLICDVDEAAGVYDVVRGVEDAAFYQRLAVPGLGEHVVGAPGHDTAAQLGYRLVVQHGPKGARGEDVAGDRQDLIRLHGLGAELFHRTLDRGRLDVRHDQVRTLIVEQAAQVVADVP